MKRKFLIVIYTLLAAIFLNGCSSGSIVNNKDTGEIEVGDKAYFYEDGVYKAITSYYDANGYFSVAKVNVTDGKIVSISYDRINRKVERFSQLPQEETMQSVESFLSDVKSLNSKVMQNQNAENLSSSSEYAADYKLLLEATLNNAAVGDTTLTFVDTHTTYNEIFENPSTECVAHLSVSYNGALVSSINYYITDQNGLKIEDYPEGERQFSEYMSYKALIEFLNSMPTEGAESLIKEPITEQPLSVFDDYNQLASIVEEKHEAVELNNEINQLFSSL